MAYELIRVSELPETTTPDEANVLPIQAGDTLKKITFDNLKEAVTGDLADDLAAEVTAREGAVSGEATARGNADTAIMADLASPYSTSATYAVGDYCTKDGQLYRCTTAISTAEAWTAAHWSAVALGDDTRDLRSALNTQMAEVKGEISYPLNIYKRITFANGSYKTIGSWTSGINDVATRIYGQVELINPVNSITITPTNASYNFEYALFDSENAKIVSSSGWNSQPFVYTGIVAVKTVRVDVRKTNNANISPTQDTGIVIGVNGATDLDTINALVSNIVKTITFDNSARIRAVSNNVGKYNFGEGNGYTGADYADKFLEWKRRVGKNMPDFVMLQENVLYFDSGQTIMARDIWDPLFPYIASDSGSLGISIRSRYPLSNAQKITLETVESGVTYTRYLVVAEANIHGKKVAVAVTHLTPGYNSPYEEVRQSEVAQVITALSGYDNVILGGDFNTSDATTLGLFTTAGYTLGNNGYFGAIETLSGEYVDNIIIKGLSFYDVYSNASEAITSDHYPIVAEMMLP